LGTEFFEEHGEKDTGIRIRFGALALVAAGEEIEQDEDEGNDDAAGPDPEAAARRVARDEAAVEGKQQCYDGREPCNGTGS
jgi:hypothetical protein